MRLLLCVFLLAGGAKVGHAATNCPLCFAPTQTWSEIVSESKVVVLAKLVSRYEGDERTKPAAVFDVVRVHKGQKHLSAKRRIHLDEFVYGDVKDTFLLTASETDSSVPALLETFATASPVKNASRGGSFIRQISAVVAKRSDSGIVLQWDSPVAVDAAEFQYITQAPTAGIDALERLRYFLPFLEHNRNLVASDAWGEFARSEYGVIKQLSDLYSTTSLRAWIANGQTSPERLSLYGLMLGMCGDEDDAAFLQEQIGPGGADELRFGVEGMMGGLLALTGVDGLAFLERTRLRSDVPTLEAFAAVQAIQFIWNHEPDRIDKQRLRNSLHLTLNDESLREISITNLARWEDWTLVRQLPQIYDACRDDDNGTTRAIVGYLLVYRRAPHPETAADDVKLAESLLQKIRKEKPRLVKAVEWELNGPPQNTENDKSDSAE